MQTIFYTSYFVMVFAVILTVVSTLIAPIIVWLDARKQDISKPSVRKWVLFSVVCGYVAVPLYIYRRRNSLSLELTTVENTSKLKYVIAIFSAALLALGMLKAGVI